MTIANAERRDAFSSITSSAAVVPTQTLDQVIEKAHLMGGLLPECRQFNIPSNLTVPIGNASNKANWHIEGTPVAAEDPSALLSKVSFGAFEILKVFSISAATKLFSVTAFESYITDELEIAVMQTIADGLVNGTGASNGQGTGILTGVTWDSTNSLTYSISGLMYDDFANAIAKMKRGYLNQAKWAMSNATLYSQVYKIKTSTGKPIFLQDTQTGGIGYILGFPVVIDDNLPLGTILLGSWRYHAYNLPQGIMIQASYESSFKSGLVDFRVLAICDIKPLVAEAFCILTQSLT